jgi:hypothetical protein
VYHSIFKRENAFENAIEDKGSEELDGQYEMMRLVLQMRFSLE